MFDRLSLIVSDIFEVPADLIVEDTSPENTPQWDSLRTIGLVVALEDEFGIQMSKEEITRMRSIGAMRQLLRAKGILDV